MSLNGYDISNNQGNIDNGVVPGDFVFIKATEGIGWTDPDCDANYQQAKAAGKLLGVYHFARPDGNPDGSQEADWFVSQIKGYIGEAVLALDFETAPFNVAWAKAFLDRVYALTGVRPLLYSYQSVLNGSDWSSVWVDYGLWLAEPGNNPGINGYQVPGWQPSVNGNWNIALWQYSSHGRLNGWGADLDLDLFYGDANGWHAYARVETSQPATPPAQPPVPPVEPPVLPPVVPPVTEPPIVTPVVTPPVETPVVKPKDPPVVKGLLEFARLLVFAIPGILIQVLTKDPSLALGYGAPILGVLRSVDAYIHANPDTNLNGLLPF